MTTDNNNNQQNEEYSNGKLIKDILKQTLPLAMIGFTAGSAIGISNMFMSKKYNNLILKELKNYKYIMNDCNLSATFKEFFKFLVICPSYKEYLLNYCNKIIKIWHIANVAYEQLPEERKNSFIINHDMIIKIIDYRGKLGNILSEINNITFIFNNYWIICGNLIMASPINAEIVEKKNYMVNYILKTGKLPKFENNSTFKFSSNISEQQHEKKIVTSIEKYYHRWWIYMHTKYITEMRHVAYLKNWISIVNVNSNAKNDQIPNYSKEKIVSNDKKNNKLVINEKEESNFIKKKWNILVKLTKISNDQTVDIEDSLFDKLKIWFNRIKDEGVNSVYQNPYKNFKLGVNYQNIPNYILDNNLYDKQAMIITSIIDNYFEGVLEYSHKDKHKYSEKFIDFDLIRENLTNEQYNDNDEEENDKNPLQYSYYTV